MSKASVSSGKKIQPATQKSKIEKVLNREQMISDAAYSLAKQRRFESGDPIIDWMATEAEIDAVLRKH